MYVLPLALESLYILNPRSIPGADDDEIMSYPQKTFTATTFADGSFWKRRRDIVRSTTLLYQLDMLKVRFLLAQTIYVAVMPPPTLTLPRSAPGAMMRSS